MPLRRRTASVWIPITDIRYAERIDKHIDYHLTDNTVIHSTSFNGSFQNAVAGLLAHKKNASGRLSFVVNLFHVTEVTRSDLLLTGNLHVPVPAVCMDTVKGEWADFLAEWRQIPCFLRIILLFDIESYDHLRRYFLHDGFPPRSSAM